MVDVFVGGCENGTGGSIESYGSAFLVEHGSLAYCRRNAVESHNVAGCRYPQWQIGGARLAKIAQSKY